ncbi:unnamed protein product [Spirodela intermedia]|uniref:Uncharacterized protein n=1 Tax=Spirodela intermedia TaxID=51605 RepID=A0A7I8JF81_SPIIN|nr:unnamed protein product [Spirodela intermedia]CAA6668838.1 unnamed protein product [Spirodela intermedia]
MDRRKKAEDALEHLQNILQRMAEQLSPVSAVTFSLSRPGGKDPLWDASSAAQFCQEVIGLGRGRSRGCAEAVIEAKNHEIARLRDRLQYYEAVNQEMSQRNQEAIELARRQRQRRKVRRRWVVGCVGLSIAVGASLMAFSYLGGAHGGRHEPAPVAAAELPAEARSAFTFIPAMMPWPCSGKKQFQKNVSSIILFVAATTSPSCWLLRLHGRVRERERVRKPVETTPETLPNLVPSLLDTPGLTYRRLLRGRFLADLVLL